MEKICWEQACCRRVDVNLGAGCAVCPDAAGPQMSAGETHTQSGGAREVLPGPGHWTWNSGRQLDHE